MVVQRDGMTGMAQAANENQRFEQFSAVLLTELLERTRKNLELLRPEAQPCSLLPFAQTPVFVDIYVEIVRIGIFPVVISRRPVRAVQGDVDWAREGREYLQTLLDDRSNPVFVAWDYAWDALWSERKTTGGHGQGGQPSRERKGGFLSSLFGRNRDHAKADGRENGDGESEVMEGLYAMLTGLAERRGFLPLFPDDVRIFKSLIRLKPGRIVSAMKELSQYHHQEFVMIGEDQAKPGVLNEALQKWHFNLPDRLGELLVLKCAVDLEHVNKAFIGKYIRQSARSQEEAERGMPYLSVYWKSMPNRVSME